MNLQVGVVILFSIIMWALVFLRLNGGIVEVKDNRRQLTKNMRGARPCVVSMYVGDVFGTMRDELMENKYAYCKAMNYTCKIYTRAFRQENRPLAWQKLYALEKSFHACGLMMWVDGDAVFTSHKPIPTSNKELLFAREGDGVNSGVMVLRNTRWVRDFIDRVSKMREFDESDTWEQAAINYLIRTEKDVSSRVEIVPQRVLNSFDVRDAPFIYHPSGKPNKLQLWKTALRPYERITVVSMCTAMDRYKNPTLRSVSLQNKMDWCELWDQPCKMFNQLKPMQTDHPKWDKLLHVQRILKHANTSWILWMDCDAIITNYDVTPDDILTQIPTTAHLVLSHDKNGRNLGVFLLRVSAQSRELVSNMISHIPRLKGSAWKDQQALIEVIKANPRTTKLIFRVPQKRFNAYYTDGGKHGAGYTWTSGDFIAHQVWCRNPRCDPAFIQLAKKVKPFETVFHKPTQTNIRVPVSEWTNEFVKRVKGDGWEPRTRRMIHKILTDKQPKRTFQVGMHVGGHLIPMALAFPNLQFVAMDPEKTKVLFVRRALRFNHIRNVELIHGGIDIQTAPCALDKTFKNAGMWHIVHKNTSDVHCYRIDDMNYDFDFLHLDLEGAEFKAIQSAEKLIRKRNPVLIFENDHVRNKTGLYKFLRAHKYKKRQEIEHNELWYI